MLAVSVIFPKVTFGKGSVFLIEKGGFARKRAFTVICKRYFVVEEKLSAFAENTKFLFGYSVLGVVRIFLLEDDCFFAAAETVSCRSRAFTRRR